MDLRSKVFIIVFFLTNLTHLLYGQCSIQGLTSSLFCNDAPVLCELDCLDGFIGRTPDQLFLPQPPKGSLCQNGGNPDNMSWFAFVAGSTEISITITPYNCTQVDPTTFGLQAGIYSSCDFENRQILDCFNDFTIMSPSPITLSSTDFVVGQIYYVWVDGAAGTICDYRITVNKGSQPYELPEIDSISVLSSENDYFRGDTIRLCRGIDSIKFKIEDYNLDIFYKWTIEPASVEYPSGEHPSKIDSSLWSFSTVGAYDICVVADNRCDTTQSKCIRVIVEDLPDQDFGIIEVCANMFPYAGPQNVDLFGDGRLFSWEGPNIISAGANSYNVSMPNGCRYTQTVNVELLPLGSRVPVVEVSCGPFNYHGTEITENVSGLPINIIGGASSGCDSLVSLDAYIISVGGNFITGVCSSNVIPLAFSLTDVSCPPGYSIEYLWRDGNGDLLIDTDGIDSIIEISSTMMVTLELRITYLGASCDIFIGGKFVDVESVFPALPDISILQDKFCSDINDITLTIQPAANADSYEWVIPSGLNIIGNSDGGSIRLSMTDGFERGEICVRAVNSCGNSGFACKNIKVVTVPEVEIVHLGGECVNEPISLVGTITAGDDPNLIYNWTNSGASQVQEIGVRERFIIYDTPGVKIVSLQVENESCISKLVEYEFEVFDKIKSPVISCQSTANSILIDWSTDDCVTNYDLEINGGALVALQGSSYLIDSLEPGSPINIRLFARSECPCGDVISTTTCYALDCGNALISLYNPNPVICQDDWSEPVQIRLNIENTHSNVLPVWSGTGINQEGVFFPMNAGVGQHKIFVDIDDMGCKYRDSVVFQLFNSPDLSLRTLDPQCVEDLFGSILLSDIVAGDSYHIELDGVRVGEEIEGVSIGEHTLVLIDANQCKSIRRVTIHPPLVPDYELKGDTLGYDNGVLRFSVKPMGYEQKSIDSVAWYINGELYCSGSDCFDISLSNFPAGSYVHQLFIYYDDCFIEDRFSFEVKEIYRFYISNAIRPRANNGNSKWVVKTNDNSLIIKNVSIYNRWGNLIFDKSGFNPNDEEFIWDGSYNDSPVAQDVYVYIIRYIDELGRDQVITGDITVFD